MSKNGTSPIHASCQRLKSGNAKIKRAAERTATPQSAREGASERTRLVKLDNRAALPGSSWEDLETTSSIWREFTKSEISDLREPKNIFYDASLEGLTLLK